MTSQTNPNGSSYIKPQQKSSTSFLKKLIKGISKIFVGAILLYAIGHFVPELRHEIPALYRAVDFLLGLLNGICSFVFWFLK